MIEGHGITLLKLENGSGRDRLLTGTEVHFTGDPAMLPELAYRFFEAAAEKHAPVQVVYAWPFDPDRVARLFAEEIQSRIA